jgi:hypothetical protein
MTVFFSEGVTSFPSINADSPNWVVLDANLDNLEELIQGVQPDHQIHVLDAFADGVNQLTQLLQAWGKPVETLYLVAHGAPGLLQLGNGVLAIDSIQIYADQLQQWSVKNLVIYGCQVAAGDAGEELLEKLQQLTQANIVASTQKVGQAALGGSWHLDVCRGEVADADPFTSTLKATYRGVFNTVTRKFTITTDNEDNNRTGSPDGDFGRGIRVGAFYAVNTNTNPNLRLPIQPIEFNILTNIPQSDDTIAVLLLSIFDIDSPNERNEVFFNGTFVGIAEGQNNLTFRTVIPINPALVVNPNFINPGKNFVQINVDTLNANTSPPPDKNPWEAEIEKAELVVNYPLGQTLGDAFLDTKATDKSTYKARETVRFRADIDTTRVNTQTIIVESLLRSPSGDVIAFDTRSDSANIPINGTNDSDQFTWNVPLPAYSESGTWTIDFAVFDQASGEFQFYDRQPFFVCGTPGPELVFNFVQYVQYQEIVRGLPYTGDQSTLFDERFYLVANPDVRDAVLAGLVTSGFQHFEVAGRAEGRSLLPLNLRIGSLDIAFLFDETYYLANNPDIFNALNKGNFILYGYEHFVKYGLYEGRNPSAYYNEAFYLATNPDVQAAVNSGQLSSGLQHFIFQGHIEERSPSKLFNAPDYLLQNPDVQAAIDAGFVGSGFEHFIEQGAAEGRLNTSLYEESFYLEKYPDIQAAVNAGIFDSGYKHYLIAGQWEGRDPSPGFDEGGYLGCNPDVAAALPIDPAFSGMAHYFLAGRGEGRSPYLVFPEPITRYDFEIPT